MHGHETGFSHFLITEVDSMGGVVDFGVGLDIKTSPHRAAITKAQEELRLEYDVREECRRELEFLEKGGNPLDFKLGRAASISLQSTSFTDQPVENETKRSFALPSSPHGDSAESSGHHGGSICQEPNIADNLVLFGNGKSNKGGEKSAKRTGKRTNLNPLEKASQVDAHHNLKDSSDSLISRLGANGQAYARRNRSRSSRDNHVNKCLTLPTSSGDFRDAKGLQRGVHAEEHAVSSVSNSKSDAPVKDSSITYVSEREIDVDKTENMSSDNTKGFANVVATTTSEKVQVIEHDVVPVERATCGSANQPSQLIALDYASVAFPSATPGVIENTSSSHPVKENDCNVSDVDLIDLHDDYMKDKKNVSDTSELVREKNINMDPAHLVTRFPNGDVVADDSVLRTDASREEETCRMPSTCSILTGRIQLTGSVVHTGSDKSICLPANLGNSVVHVKDEKVPFEVDGDNIIEKSLPNIKCSEARKSDIYLGESFHAINTPVVTTSTEDPSLTIAKTVSSILPNLQNREAVQVKLSKKDHESAVLSEARIIEANLKRAAALSKSSLSTEKRHKCHWDYVLEEMAWMANDFMQERIWKRTAAAQVSQFIASVGRSKFEQELLFREQKNIARTLAKAVMHFWRSTKAVHAKCGATSSNNKDCDGDPCDLSNANGFDIMKDQGVENHGQFLPLGIQSYALRFLNYISTTFNDPDPVMTEATYTTKRINGAVISESMDDQHSGESLFYKVPPGAMLSYRESVESQWANYKKLGNIVCREDCEASLCGSITDGPRASAFEEDEGETGPGIVRGTFEGNFSFKLTSTKKKKLQQRLYTQTFYEGGHDSSYGPYPVGKSANQSLPSIGKRPSSTINVGMAPTKRTRTAARQRIINPFGTGVTGVPQMTSRTDGSSGDTSSFQDDQCSMHGDSQLWKHLEVESTADFGRRLPFVGIERPSKSKKKRKSKQLGYKGSLNLDDSGIMAVSRRGLTFEHRLHADFMMQQDQRDLMEKRSESQPFEPNGNPGFYGQHVAKKAKFMKHADCNEQTALAGGAILSPVASQMSNMSNSNKLIRIMNHRDRGRKSKAMKVAAGQSGSGSAWSSFEDQALVVLVHDMGLNWGLVSDALNSTLLFKCIYRKPEDCKERHKFLMDRSAGDGADSAEDSGSSQPYQSTLPGIPKGSARQLFQRLHGPMEEDTLKSRFEKIILIGQRLHSCRIQGNNQDSKKITPAHGSHVLSLSQAYPNNLAGAVLSPLDLCDAVTSPDINTHGCHGSYSTGIAVASHQGSLAPVLSNSCSSTIVHGCPSMAVGNGLSSSPSVNTSPRDAQRYAIPRSINLLVDDQQRQQNYTQIFSGRNMQQNGILSVASSPGVVDCGVRMLHGSNGTGVLSGTNRSVSMSRSGFQGINPSGMLNMASTNNLLSINSVGTPSPVSAHSTVISGPGNTLMRAREGMQMVRPAQSSEEHKQTLIQDIQLQASQGNTQVVNQQLSGTSVPFCNAAVSPPIQTLPVQQQQPHQIPQILGSSHPSHILSSDHSSTPQHPYLRFSKERQQQRTIQSTQNTMHNNSQLQQQSQPASVNLTSSSQSQQKQQPIPRNPQPNGAISTQIMKQRQRHQVEQQQPRSMQQQKQPQQHAKHLKSLGRGSVLIHPNLPADGSHFSGLQVAPKTQSSEKHLVQGPFSGNTGISPSFQHANPHKLYSRPPVQLSKHAPLVSSLPDSKQPSMQAPPIHAVASHQSVPSSVPLPTQQQLRQAPPNMQRMGLQQNHHLKPDGQLQSSSELVQVKQMVPVASGSQTAESINPPLTLPSGTHWKPDPSMERNTSSHENLSGNNAVKVSSRQLSGSMSILGHVAGGQWQQQQNSKTQSSLPSLQQNQQGVQGNIHTRPLNAEPG